MSRAIHQAEKESFYLVAFVNAVTGDAFARFTTLDSDFSFEGEDYLSETRMTVKLPRNDGTLAEEQCLVGIPRSHQFAQDVTTGLRYPATNVIVIEIVKGDGAIAISVLRPFHGLMVLARRKLGGRRGVITISATSIKARLQNVSLGLPCMQNCVNWLGDIWCKVNMTASPHKLSLFVDSIDGPEVTMTGTVPTGLEDRFYQRGSITIDGFEFAIRDWRNEVEGNRHVFFLWRRPPDWWLTRTAVVLAGCDKTKRTCDGRYANIANFRAPGIKMLPYNPIYEEGGGE